MEWKKNARKIPTNHMRRKLEEETETFFDKRVVTRNGKSWVVWDHTRDLVVEDDQGVKTIIASTKLKRGDYLFPCAYVHPQGGFVGEVKDARLTESGWIIYIEAVLRDRLTGEPVKLKAFGGCMVDKSGWFRESSLRDAKLGIAVIRPGATSPSVEDLVDAREDRIKRHNR